MHYWSMFVVDEHDIGLTEHVWKYNSSFYNFLTDNTDAFQSSTQSGIPKNNDHGMLKLDGKIVTNDESPNLLCLENIDEKASSVV